jgi:hypothetical protein
MGIVPSVVRDVLDRRSSLERQVCELGDLAETILNHARGTDTEVIRATGILDEIERELRELIELKSARGYFNAVLDVAPQAKHTIEVLMNDHQKLLADLSKMREQLPPGDHFLTVRKELHGWIQRFHEIDSREIALLQNVWNVDVGISD